LLGFEGTDKDGRPRFESLLGQILDEFFAYQFTGMGYPITFKEFADFAGIDLAATVEVVQHEQKE
jgi:hypothetical protein